MDEHDDYADPPPWWHPYIPSGETLLKCFVLTVVIGMTASLGMILFGWR
jgi:hypothetical protein